MRFFAAVLVFLLCGSVLAHVNPMPDFKDKRDGRVYKTVLIGDQRWFAENLRFKIKGSWCYDKRDYNCDTYGRLYDWSMAMSLVDYYNWNSIKKLKQRVHDVCPVGWHVPTNKDWKKLKYYVGKKGKSDGVGISLKSPEIWEKELRIPDNNNPMILALMQFRLAESRSIAALWIWVEQLSSGRLLKLTMAEHIIGA